MSIFFEQEKILRITLVSFSDLCVIHLIVHVVLKVNNFTFFFLMNLMFFCRFATFCTFLVLEPTFSTVFSSLPTFDAWVLYLAFRSFWFRVSPSLHMLVRATIRFFECWGDSPTVMKCFYSWMTLSVAPLPLYSLFVNTLNNSFEKWKSLSGPVCFLFLCL